MNTRRTEGTVRVCRTAEVLHRTGRQRCYTGPSGCGEHPADGGHGPGLSTGRGVTPDRQAVVNREHPADGGHGPGLSAGRGVTPDLQAVVNTRRTAGYGPGLSAGRGVTPDLQAVVNPRRTAGTVRVCRPAEVLHRTVRLW